MQACAHGWLSLLATPFLSDHHFEVPFLASPLFPSPLSGSQGSSEDIFISYCIILWGPHSFPQLPSSMCPSPKSLSTGQTAPCVLGPCIQSSKLLRSEMNPLLILHTASLKRHTIHQPARDLGIVLAASKLLSLRVNQSSSFVMPAYFAYLIYLKSTYFFLFHCNCPA